MRVLVADDEPDMAHALEAMLKREHYAVDVACDGQQALDAALALPYDCLVLDVMMPRKDGIEVLRALRERGVGSPVLLLTAKGEPADRVFGLNQGADDYLPKPFFMDELLARVRALTRRRGVVEPAQLAAGDLILDRTTFELVSGDARVRLGNKEFQIVELLMRHPGRLVTAEAMRERVWGYDAAGDAALWTYISYLRRKLSNLGSRARIVASRGRGYALETDAC